MPISTARSPSLLHALLPTLSLSLMLCALAPQPCAAAEPASAVPANAVVLDPAVDAYLERALALIQAHALHQQHVNWPQLRAELRAGLAGAESSIETYAALRRALAALEDRHSFLQLPDALEAAEAHWLERQHKASSAQQAASPPTKPSPLPAHVQRRGASLTLLPVGTTDAAPVALLNIAAYIEQTGLDAHASYIDALLRQAEQAGVNHWILDLRGNGGGNVFPMLAGLSALIGEGELISARGRDGRKLSFRVDQGAAKLLDFDGRQDTVCAIRPAPMPLKRPARVAVLIDRYTGSAGEMLALALRTLPSTRLFGERSAGATTATDGFRLPDGANLVLAVADNQDRLGRTAPDGLTVDEPTDAAHDTGTPLRDPGVQAALHWFSQAH